MKNGSLIKGAFVAAAASLALSAAPIAQAGTLTGSGISGEGVTISIGGVTTNTTAGVFTGTFDQDGAGPIPVVNNLLLWCIDIFQRVGNPFNYPDEYTAAIYQSAPLTFSGARQQDLARLFFNNYGTALTNTQTKAAFQLAIWDILFDTDADLSTAGAGFGASGNAGAINMAQGFIAGLGSGTPSLLAVQFTSGAHQDFITPGLIPGVECIRCQQVPEPSPLPLLVIGAAGMLFAMRRRNTVPHRT